MNTSRQDMLKLVYHMAPQKLLWQHMISYSREETTYNITSLNHPSGACTKQVLKYAPVISLDTSIKIIQKPLLILFLHNINIKSSQVFNVVTMSRIIMSTGRQKYNCITATANYNRFQLWPMGYCKGQVSPFNVPKYVMNICPNNVPLLLPLQHQNYTTTRIKCSNFNFVPMSPERQWDVQIGIRTCSPPPPKQKDKIGNFLHWNKMACTSDWGKFQKFLD